MTIREVAQRLGLPEQPPTDHPLYVLAMAISDAGEALRALLLAALNSERGKALMALGREIAEAQQRRADYEATPEGRRARAEFDEMMKAFTDAPAIYATPQQEPQEVHHHHYITVENKGGSDDGNDGDSN